MSELDAYKGVRVVVPAVGIVLVALIIFLISNYKKPNTTVDTSLADTYLQYKSMDIPLVFMYPSRYSVNTHTIDINALEGTFISLIPIHEIKPKDGEGSPQLTIAIFDNSKKLKLADFLAKTSGILSAPSGGWKFRDTTVAGAPALAYTSTGLYESDNVALEHLGKVYVFSADWITRDDKTLTDLATLLASVSFTQ